jgi:hypothetical protein
MCQISLQAQILTSAVTDLTRVFCRFCGYGIVFSLKKKIQDVVDQTRSVRCFLVACFSDGSAGIRMLLTDITAVGVEEREVDVLDFPGKIALGHRHDCRGRLPPNSMPLGSLEWDVLGGPEIFELVQCRIGSG